MISRDLLDKLHCPYCGSRFDLELKIPATAKDIQYGVLRCACYRYPIVDGIPILRQRSGSADTLDKAVAYLETGDVDGALRHTFYYDSPVSQSQTRWQRAAKHLGLTVRDRALSLPGASSTFREALHLYRPPGFANYLLHRAANNSFLAAIPLLLLLKELEQPSLPQDEGPRVLDLNCGVGHASFFASVLFPNVSTIATDHDFVNIYLARRHMIPDTPCLCLDAELPLPFEDSFFDAVLCMDGLHYVRSKRALIKELDRSVKETGIWLFPHMHNALAQNVSPGVPLSPDTYQRCFEFLPSQLFVELEIFREFMRNQMLDLSGLRPSERLDRAPVFSLVASRRTDIWREHHGLGEWLLKTISHLKINPIYQRKGDKDGIQLTMAWPNATLERECEPVKEFLPQTCSIDPSLWSRLTSRSLRDEDQPGLEALIKSFVLVPLPDNYT